MGNDFQRTSLYETPGDVFRGSVRIDLSAYATARAWSWVPAGAHDGVVFTPQFAVNEEEVDDAQMVRRLAKLALQAQMTMYEVLKITMRETIEPLTKTVSAGDPAVPDAQTVASGWVANQAYLFSAQPASGVTPVLTSVAGSSSGAGALDDDYFVFKAGDGLWYIYFKTDGDATFETTESILITYDTNTLAASTRLAYGSVKVIPTIAMKFTGLNEGGKKVELIMYKTQLLTPGALTPLSDNDEEKRMIQQLTMQGDPDANYSDNSYEIEIYE